MNKQTCSCTQCATDEEQNKVKNQNTNCGSVQTQLVLPRYSIAPGEYVATVENARHYKHKKQHHDVVQIWLEISDAFGNMELLPKYYNINSKDSRKFMQAELARIGLEIETPDDMEKLPKKLSGMEIPVTLDFNDQGYPVIYFWESDECESFPKNILGIWED